MPLAQKERLFAESKAMGASYIRVDVELSGIWRGSGDPADWSALDQVLALSRRHDLPVLGIVLGTPSWLGRCFHCPPDDFAEYDQLVGELAQHARGVIDTWEILNEPDGSWFFEGTAQDYARMLNASYDAVKLRFPGARVALGESPRSPRAPGSTRCSRPAGAGSTSQTSMSVATYARSRVRWGHGARSRGARLRRSAVGHRARLSGRCGLPHRPWLRGR
jgi:hypothetical protein